MHVIGFKAAHLARSPDKNIHIYPLYRFRRLHPGRLLAPFLFFHKTRQIKPDLIIVHAVELLGTAILYKWFYKTPLIYDVQENYYRNIRYQSIYPYPFKGLIAAIIRSFECLTQPFVDHYLLAEKAYADELPFVKNKQTIIENKAQIGFTKEPFVFNKDKLKLLYSGTISTVYGAREAIALIEALRAEGVDAQLTFAGVFAEKKLDRFIRRKIRQTGYIHLIGRGEVLLPHEQILEAFRQTDLAVLPYPPNKSTENCIPTKLYECLAMACPMIIQRNRYWQKLCEPYRAAVWVDFRKIAATRLVRELRETVFYPQGSVKEAFWEEEKGKLKIVGKFFRTYSGNKSKKHV